MVDHQERGRQSGAAVLVARAAPNGGTLGVWGGCEEMPYLYRGEYRGLFWALELAHKPID
jgi:hypothetical protein